jgi:hypothetical protein
MIVTIIQRLWKEGSKTKKIIMKVLVIKTQINPTTYYIFDNKETTNQTFHYCNYDNNKRTNPS